MTTKYFDDNERIVLEYSIVFTFVGLIVPLSLAWNIYFVRRILHFNRLQCVCVEREKSDPFGNYIEAVHQNMAMKIKYIFLLLINITEVSGISTYALGSVLTQTPNSYNHIYSNHQETIPNCTTELIHSQISELRLFYGNPLNSILIFNWTSRTSAISSVCNLLNEVPSCNIPQHKSSIPLYPTSTHSFSSGCSNSDHRGICFLS